MFFKVERWGGRKDGREEGRGKEIDNNAYMGPNWSQILEDINL